MTTKEIESERDRLFDMLSIIVTNVEMAPDPRMQGYTDCYLISLDDITNAGILLEELKKEKK